MGAFNEHSAANRAGDAQRAFQDRVHAGDALARSLIPFASQRDVVVLGLARGGVPLARQVADVLGVPISVFISGKIGVPGIEEVALGAIAEGSDHVVTDSMAWYIGVPQPVIERLAVRERVELMRRTQLYRNGEPLPDLEGKTVVLVDDGLATGATIRAAARAIRSHRPRRLVAAVPVASRLGMADIRDEVDEIVAVVVGDEFASVSAAYETFEPMTDDEVLIALGRPIRRVSGMVYDISGLITDSERTIEIPIPGGRVVGDLGTPTNIDFGESGRASHDRDALAILVHAGGSSRDSYRNRYIAGRLRLEGYATLRVDLLTRDEEALDAQGGSIRFDVAKIAARLTDVCDWAVRAGVYGARRAILFGAGTGAAGALMTAARRQSNTLAVVVRGGRVDLAESALSRVRAPVLSIVGTEDREIMVSNSNALRLLRRSKLIRVRGAGQTFGEPGALGAVAEHSVKWLHRVAASRGRTAAGWRRSAS